ncbi:MAG: helix-turn-helix domain-containing protein [Desulfurococcales archaeon]|nr:helix-turn-helix domain-containing protein [Desulfurococcales archaeon]
MTMLKADILGDTLCEAWNEGLTISEIPTLLGISRPTFYKILKEFYAKGQIIRFLPNINALGYEILVTNTRSRSGLNTYNLFYVKSRESRTVKEILETLGVKVEGLYRISYVLCSAKKMTICIPASKSMRPSLAEVALIKELSIRFTHTRDLAVRTGLSWQRVTSLIQKIKEKGLIVSPIIHSADSQSMTGAIIRQTRKPDPRDLAMLSPKYSVIVLSSVIDPNDFLVIAMTSTRRILDYTEHVSSNKPIIKEVVLTKNYPWPPMSNEWIIGEGEAKSISEQLVAITPVQIPVGIVSMSRFFR